MPPAKKTARAAAAPTAEQPRGLTMKAVLAAINDGADDPHTVAELNRALYRMGAQDYSMELPRSWVRVQRRLGVDADKLTGVATAEQVAQFAERTGLVVSK